MNSDVNQPFFSILIPSYNRPEDIERNIQSILADDFKDIEIIISDDNSPKAEEIKEILDPFLKHKNIHFFQQPINLREPNNKNFLVNKATGKYNIVLGDDDRFCEQALSKLKIFIDRNPNYDLYGFGYKIVDEQDKTIMTLKAPQTLEISINNPALLKETFLGYPLPLWLFHPATFCCKQGLEAELKYQADVGIGEDLFFILDLLSKGGKILLFPDFVFYWRKIQEKTSSLQANQSLAINANFIARLYIYNKLLAKQVFALPDLAEFINSKKFRERFLYDAIIADSRIKDKNYFELLNNDQYYSELKNYKGKGAFKIRQYGNFLKWGIILINHLGVWDGGKAIIKFIYDRISYKIKIRL